LPGLDVAVNNVEGSIGSFGGEYRPESKFCIGVSLAVLYIEEKLKPTSMELAGSEGIKSSVERFTTREGKLLIDLFVDRGINTKSCSEIHEVS
jgi:hypothetical protein